MPLLLRVLGADGWLLDVEGPARRLPAFLPPVTVATGWRGAPAGLEALQDGMLAAVPPDGTPPLLFESTTYTVTVQSPSAEPTLRHRSAREVSRRRVGGHRLAQYALNVGNAVGSAALELDLDGQRVGALDVEVAAEKVDYRADHARMRDDVEAVTLGLAQSALAATGAGATPAPGTGATLHEWLGLARANVAELAGALGALALDPHTVLFRAATPVPTGRARHVDDRALRAVLGRPAARAGGQARGAAGVVPLPARLPERRSRLTLDTVENRYVKGDVLRLVRRLDGLVAEAAAELPSGRPPTLRERWVREVAPEAAAASRLLVEQLASPLWRDVTVASPGLPRSQVLQSHPLYARVARLLRLLRQRVALGGEVMDVGLRDTATLYEFWVFLTLVRGLGERLATESQGVVVVEPDGLQVTLRRGAASRVVFRDPGSGRRVTATYNPSFDDLPTLPQRPDVWIEVEGAPRALLLDAKYRLSWDDDYVRQYGGSGPPRDVVDTMHRYRDAIVRRRAGRWERAVDQAVAVFPLADPVAFADHRFRRSVDEAGVGALPALPGAEDDLLGHVRRWLTAQGVG